MGGLFLLDDPLGYVFAGDDPPAGSELGDDFCITVVTLPV